MTISTTYRYVFYDTMGVYYGTPLGEQDLSLNFEAPSENLLGYILSIAGQVRFVAADFQRFYTSLSNNNLCSEIPMVVQRKVGSAWKDIVSGIIPIQEGDWDLDKCILEIEPRRKSPTEIIESTEDVNLFDLIPVSQRVTVNMVPEGEAPDIITNKSEEHLYISQDTETPPTPGGDFSLYKFTKTTNNGFADYDNGEFLGCNLVDGEVEIDYDFDFVRYAGWISDSATLPLGWSETGVSADGQRKISRPVILDTDPVEETYYTDEICTVHEVTTYEILSALDSTSGTSNINVDNGLKLSSMLSAFCGPLNLVPKSDFFNINSGDPVNGVINYVTGEDSTTASIVFFQKSDVKRPDNDNATIFKMSLKDLLKWLVNTFNVRFTVVENQLVIEHISRIAAQGTLDLTLPEYQRWVKNRFKYRNKDIPTKETFRFMDTRPDVLGLNDFNGVPIIYHLKCSGAESKDTPYSVDKITTDINWVLNENNKDTVSDDGFVMASCSVNGSGEYHIRRDQAILGLSREINNVFGWAYLHKHFWRHKRYMTKGMMNGVETTFLSSINRKIGEKFSIPYCNIEDFNPNVTVDTKIGTGEIDTAVFSFRSKMLELTLSYPDPIEVPPVEPVTVYATLEFISSGEVPPDLPYYTIYGTLRLKLYKDELKSIPYISPVDFSVKYNQRTYSFNYTTDTATWTDQPREKIIPVTGFVGNTAEWSAVEYSKGVKAVGGEYYLIQSSHYYNILDSDNYNI